MQLRRGLKRVLNIKLECKLKEEAEGEMKQCTTCNMEKVA